MVGKNLEREWPLLFAVLQFNNRAGRASASRWDAGPPRKVDRIDLDQAPCYLRQRTAPHRLKRWGRGGTAEQKGRTCRGIRRQLSTLKRSRSNGWIVDIESGDSIFIYSYQGTLNSSQDISRFELSNMAVSMFTAVAEELLSSSTYDTTPKPISNKRRTLCRVKQVSLKNIPSPALTHSSQNIILRLLEALPLANDPPLSFPTSSSSSSSSGCSSDHRLFFGTNMEALFLFDLGFADAVAAVSVEEAEDALLEPLCAFLLLGISPTAVSSLGAAESGDTQLAKS